MDPPDIDLLLTDEFIDTFLSKRNPDPVDEGLSDEFIDSFLAKKIPLQDQPSCVQQPNTNPPDLEQLLTDEFIDSFLSKGSPVDDPVDDPVEECLSDEFIDSFLAKEILLQDEASCVQQPNTNWNPEPLESARIKLEIGQFYDLPRSDIPAEAYDKDGASCQVLGIDTFGYVFIGFPHQHYEAVHEEAMVQMNYIYRNLDRNLDRDLSILNKDRKIEIGEILVGKSYKKNESGTVQVLFVRVQILKIVPSKHQVSAVDIDDQSQQTFHFSQLYWMMDHFYRIQMKGVKCRLSGLEEFVGTPVISAAARSCEITRFQMVVKVEEDEMEDEFPKVVLYQTQWELETGKWSFNADLTQIICNWNKAPLDFIGDMILVNIRVTQAVKGGRVFVQFQSSIMDVLSNMQPLEDLSTVDVDHILNNVIALRRIGKDMFVIKHEEGKFRRVIVQLIGNSSTTAILTHIDYGNTTIGNLHDLIPFSYFPEILEKIPAQGFYADLEQKHRELRLTNEDIDLLLSAVDIKVTFEEDPSDNKDPVIMVYFPKKEYRRPAPVDLLMTDPTRPDRPDSQCSNTNSCVSSTNFSISSNAETKLAYQRYVLPIQDSKFKIFPGRQFEWLGDKSQKMREKHISHVVFFDYEIGRL